MPDMEKIAQEHTHEHGRPWVQPCPDHPGKIVCITCREHVGDDDDPTMAYTCLGLLSPYCKETEKADCRRKSL